MHPLQPGSKTLLIASQGRQEWGNSMDKCSFPTALGLSVGKDNRGAAEKCVTGHLKRVAQAEKRRIQAFAFISSQNNLIWDGL